MANLRYPAVVALALCALALSAPHSGAQAAGQAEQAANDDRVVVTGKQAEEAIRDFVGQVAVASRSQNQLARWDRKICPGMVGLRPAYNQLIIDQVSQRALDVGLDVGGPGCAANILIIVSMDPDGVARGLFDNYKRRLGYYQEPGRKTLGRTALKAFVESKAPVRWWHVNNTMSPDGEKADNMGRAQAANIPTNLPTVTPPMPSLIKRSSRQDFARAFVIVDGRRLRGLSLAAVADYIAMASLAQLDPEVDTSNYPSILNLFEARADGSPAPASLTHWDIAYLGGLYDATRESRSAENQQREIARTMNKELLPQK